jgi:hypothetical protein
MMTDDTAAQIRAAFLGLPIRPGKEGQLAPVCQMLVAMKDPDPKAGRIPPNFRNASDSACAKELNQLAVQARRLAQLTRSPLTTARLARAARRLAATIRELHQPTILALADSGFLGGERLTLLGIARRIAQAREGVSEDDLRLLRYAADCASRSHMRPMRRSHSRGRPINLRVRAIVRILYDQVYELTGHRPTITVNSGRLNSPASGAFLCLVWQVLSALAISASAEAAVRVELNARKVHGAPRRPSAKI